MTRTPDMRFSRTLPEVVRELRRPPVPAETGWGKIGGSSGYETGAYYKNSWGNTASVSEADGQWYLSQSGEVRMRGKVTGGSAGTAITTLPDEVRPEYSETFIVPYDSDTGAIDLSHIRYRAYQAGDA